MPVGVAMSGLITLTGCGAQTTHEAASDAAIRQQLCALDQVLECSLTRRLGSEIPVETSYVSVVAAKTATVEDQLSLADQALAIVWQGKSTRYYESTVTVEGYQLRPTATATTPTVITQAPVVRGHDVLGGSGPISESAMRERYGPPPGSGSPPDASPSAVVPPRSSTVTLTPATPGPTSTTP